jgi:hypothetical protein
MTDTGNTGERDGADRHDAPDAHTITLRLELTPQDHGRFFEMPFTVPAGVEELTVSCAVEGVPFAGRALDLGLRDPARVRGWSGGARAEFTVRREWATPGYLPGELAPGAWAVIFSSNRIPPSGVRARCVIRCRMARFRWLRGDLHMHSVHSDGVYEPAQVVDMAEAAGLDFIATTDHNTSSHNFAYPRQAQIVRIPGVELTTYHGHANLLGVAEPVSDFRVNSEEDLRARFAEARRRGAKIVVNHPYKLCDTPGCIWEWAWDVGFDWVEVWNGPWRAVNEEALAWWQAQLAGGRRLVAVGGSDTHRPDGRAHGRPTTWVWCAERATPAILDAIDQGHVFVSHSPEGPTINLRCGPFMMGDELAAPEGVGPETERAGSEAAEARLTLDCLRAGDRARLLSERGVEEEWIAGSGEGRLERTWPTQGRRFYRVEVWRASQDAGREVLVALSNPLYFAPAGAAASTTGAAIPRAAAP